MSEEDIFAIKSKKKKLIRKVNTEVLRSPKGDLHPHKTTSSFIVI